MWWRASGVLLGVLMWAGAASAVTLPTRVVNGVHVYGPSSAMLVVDVLTGALTRANPYITAFTVGMTLARMVIVGTDGSITLTTAGQALLNRTNTGLVNEPGSIFQYCAQVAGTSCAGGSTQGTAAVGGSADAVARAAVLAVYPGATNFRGGVQLNPDQYRLTYDRPGAVEQDIFAWSTVRCTTGSDVTWHIGTSMTCAPGATSLEGGTQSWSPRSIFNPATGAYEEGWESPSDPRLQPQPFTPSDNLTMAPLASGQVAPQITITPNPDGGYTFQTWAPNYTTTAPITQNGWTVQTTTINNAGQVTNTSIVTNNTTGPPVTVAPVTDGTNAPQQPVQCGSLSCESTQQAIKTELQAAAAAVPPDQGAVVSAGQAADAAGQSAAIAAVTASQASDKALWPSFTWTPPGGGCSPSTGTVHGWAVAINVCSWTDKIRELLGFLMGMFTAWKIYGVLFRREST